MRDRSTRRPLAALLLAAAVTTGGLAGCTNGEGGTSTTSSAPPPTTTSPAPTPTPTPTAEAPGRPTAMSEVSPAGAEAAARYFLSLYSYAFETGDLSEWRALSHPECIFCAGVTDSVTEQRTSGEVTVGGALVTYEATVTEVTPSEFYGVDIAGSQEPWEYRDATGALLDEEKLLTEHQYIVVVVREGDAWLVREVQVDEAPQ